MPGDDLGVTRQALRSPGLRAVARPPEHGVDRIEDASQARTPKPVLAVEPLALALRTDDEARGEAQCDRPHPRFDATELVIAALEGAEDRNAQYAAERNTDVEPRRLVLLHEQRGAALGSEYLREPCDRGRSIRRDVGRDRPSNSYRIADRAQ